MNPPNRTLLVVAALAAVYVIWGSTYLGIRVAVETLPPFLMAAFRFLVAGAVLFAWCLLRGHVRLDGRAGADGRGLGRAQWGAAAIVGGLLLLGGNGLVSWGEQTVPSGLAALLVASMPLWIAVLALALLRERLTRLALAGVVLGFGGVALLVRPGTGGASAAGIAAVLAASFLWGLGSIWSQRLPLPRNPLVATAAEMLAGGTLILLVSVAAGEPSRFDPAAVSARSWVALAYLVVAGSLVAFTAYVWLLANVRSDLISTYAYVNPLVAVLLGWAVLDETITPTMVLGGAVVVAAVALVVAGRARPARQSPTGETPVQERI